MASHSSFPAWKTPWTEEPGGLQFMRSQRVGHNWMTEHACICKKILVPKDSYCRNNTTGHKYVTDVSQVLCLCKGTWNTGILLTFLNRKKDLKTLGIFFFLYHVACGILVPQPGIEPRPLAVKEQSPNHWTTREVLFFKIFFSMKYMVNLQCCTNLWCTAKLWSYTHIDILFYILFHYDLTQNTEYSSLCYTVGIADHPS